MNTTPVHYIASIEMVLMTTFIYQC